MPEIPQITPADFALIDKFVEPVTQKIQKYFGIDCFFWSGVCFVLAGLSSIVSIFIWSVELSDSPVKMLFMIWLDYQFILLSHHLVLSNDEFNLANIKKGVYLKLAEGHRNQLIWCHRPLFPLSMYLTITIVWKACEYTSTDTIMTSIVKLPFIFGYAGSCFIACTPLPPNKSKAREALEKLKERAASLGVPLPEPQPA